MDFPTALYGVPASQIMLLLNQNALVNLGEEKCMTLADIEAMEALKKNG